MLRRFSFILASLSLGAVILITTLLSADRQQPNPVNTVHKSSVQYQIPQSSVVQRFAPAIPGGQPSESLTRDEIIAAASKWDAARPVVDAFWRGEFSRRGIPYATPRVLYMVEDVIDTGCGRMERNGPFYCPSDHTIYCDPFFVAEEMKRVGKRLGTDGDMAAIVILAHEWGHAVQRLTGASNPNDEANELQADLLAGAFTRFSARQGLLERGDLEEAEMVLADGGDCIYSHGSPAQRMGSFLLGYQNG